MDKVVDNCKKDASARKVDNAEKCIDSKLVNFDRVGDYCIQGLCWGMEV